MTEYLHLSETKRGKKIVITPSVWFHQHKRAIISISDINRKMSPIVLGIPPRVLVSHFPCIALKMAMGSWYDKRMLGHLQSYNLYFHQLTKCKSKRTEDRKDTFANFLDCLAILNCVNCTYSLRERETEARCLLMQHKILSQRKREKYKGCNFLLVLNSLILALLPNQSWLQVENKRFTGIIHASQRFSQGPLFHPQQVHKKSSMQRRFS